MKGKFIVLINMLFGAFWILNPKHSVLAVEDPKEYVIKQVEVEGLKSIDKEIVLELFGLKAGDRITVPGIKVGDAVTKVLKNKIIDDISVQAHKLTKNSLSLVLKVVEKDRIIDYKFSGIKSSDEEKIIEKVGDFRSAACSEIFLINLKKIIKSHFIKKGYLLVNVEITKTKDESVPFGVVLDIKVKKNKRQKVHKIYVKGNKIAKYHDIKKVMILTKERTRSNLIRRAFINTITLKSFFKRGGSARRLRKSKLMDEVSSIMSNLTGTTYKESTFQADKEKLLRDLYYKKGYIDAFIVDSKVERHDEQCVDIYLDIFEGEQYRIGNIRWIGNKIFSDKTLSDTFQLKPYQPYDLISVRRYLLEDPLRSVSALYRSNGYLFSRVIMKNTSLVDNVIDIDVYIHEGDKAKIENVIISGSKITKDRIIRRYITTLPGDTYSNIEIMRTRNQLAKTGFVDDRKLQIIPLPNEDNNTTDIEYVIKEKIDLKASLSAGIGMYGWNGKFNIGLNNFSLRNLATLKIPMGDAQQIGVGWEKSKRHTNWSFTFLDPWIGGKRPLQLRMGFNYAYQGKEVTVEEQEQEEEEKGKNKTEEKEPYKSNISTIGVSLSIGKALKWPSYTTFYGGATFNRHKFKNYSILEQDKETGKSMDLIFNLSLERDTTDSIFYPRSGHTIFLSSKLTPPWSLMFEKYSDPNKIVNSFSEFHQWKVGASISQKIVGDLVIFGKIEVGMLGGYSTKNGPGPYRRYYLGGDGMIGDYHSPLLGQTPVKLRGYSDPIMGEMGMEESEKGYYGGAIFNKITFELRYPITLDFVIPIYILVFFEAANTWTDYNKFKFSEIVKYKSYGFGIRTVLPMIGQFGVDFGFGIDRKEKSLNPEIHLAFG